jgi:hypothetical protein
MHPYHPNWSTFCGGDKWDCKDEWATYATTRKNPNAYGGHSDALDWDRHLGTRSDYLRYALYHIF